MILATCDCHLPEPFLELPNDPVHNLYIIVRYLVIVIASADGTLTSVDGIICQTHVVLLRLKQRSIKQSTKMQYHSKHYLQ